MYTSLSEMYGYKVLARDGELGSVDDFYLDDESWMVRNLVVDLGLWIFGRKVLIATSALKGADRETRALSTDLTRQQVKDSPEIDLDRPVPRESERRLYGYYGWPLYWGYGMGMVGMGGAAAPGSRYEEASRRAPEPETDASLSHLRSAKDITGYHIRARDGSIGHVEELLVDHRSWAVRQLVADTRDWLPGRKVLISPERVVDVGLSEERELRVDLTRQSIQDSPEYDPSAQVNRD